MGARQMHLTPQHGRKSVYHSVSFHNTTSFLVSQQTEFGFPVPDDVSFGSRQRLMDEGELEAAGLCCPLTVKLNNFSMVRPQCLFKLTKNIILSAPKSCIHS